MRAGFDGRRWEIATLLPGERPLRSLAAALLPALAPGLGSVDQLAETGKLAAHLESGAISLPDVAQRILENQPGTDRLLVVVDQWEELYARATDDASRRRFIFGVLDAATHSSCSVVLTLRSDFFSWPLGDRALADALNEGQVNLGPMTRDELERAITSPAAKVGLDFEAGLVERVLDDVGDEPGNLPLLEFVLASLWERRRGPTLHFDAYRATGGVKKAIAARAEAIFETKLTQAEQQASRHVLMRMVRPGPGNQHTRKRARLPADATELAVVRHLVDARLLVTGRDVGTGERHGRGHP